MSVVVDITICSMAFRRPRVRLSNHQLQRVEALERLLAERTAVMLGAVRQETLSGIRDLHTFERVRASLRDIPDAAIARDDYERAAAVFNSLRGHGIQSSPTDRLITAVALRLDSPVFSDDRDFTRYALVLPIRLYTASATPT